MELNHVVVCHTMEGIVARVQCRTCGSEHKYHPEKKKTPKKIDRTTVKPRASQKVPAASATPSPELLEKLQNKGSIPYNLSGSYNVDDVINHETYGKGLVTKASRQRIWVLFLDGPRTLVCNWR